MSKPAAENLRLYRRMLRYLRPHVPPFLCAMALSLVIVALEGISFWLSIPLVKTIFLPDAAVPLRPELSIANAYAILKYHTYSALQQYPPVVVLQVVCLLIGLSFLAKNVVGYIKGLIMERVNLNIVRDMRDDLYRHGLRLPVTYYDRNRSSNVMSLIVRDVMLINSSMTSTLDKLVLEPLRVLFFVCVILAISARLSLVALLAFPLLAVFVAVVGAAVRRRSKRTLETFSDMLAILHETVGGIRTVKMFNMEEREAAKFLSESQRFVNRSFRASAASLLGSPVIETLGVVVAVALLLYGGSQVLARQGGLSPEDFVGFLVYLYACFKPLKVLAGVVNSLQSGFAAAERVFALLDSPTEDLRPPRGALPTPVLRQAVELRGVTFRYPGCDQDVLQDVSFEVKKGQVAAIVGASGSGKSTILDLLPRFYDIQQGAILIDGVDARSMELVTLRRYFGTVAQETLLFNDTVYNNIAYGVTDAPQEQVVACAKAANAWEFIERLPQGLHTQVGERGEMLSGGQRQRLAIARALLRNPPILILDEATSSLDTESERLVQAAINALMRNRTALVVAHRLSTIRTADLILVVEAGRIIERGTHEQLMAAAGRYRALHDLQFAMADRA